MAVRRAISKCARATGRRAGHAFALSLRKRSISFGTSPLEHEVGDPDVTSEARR
jgi:hypothetical protein